jgi:hypothetical protein
VAPFLFLIDWTDQLSAGTFENVSANNHASLVTDRSQQNGNSFVVVELSFKHSFKVAEWSRLDNDLVTRFELIADSYKTIIVDPGT